jgi:hypothetical protein
MKITLLSLVVVILIASCTKSNSVNSIAEHSASLGIITVDIDSVNTSFDSVPVCIDFARPSSNDIIINGYKKNDISKSTIQLMISGSDSITSGLYIDSVSALTKAIFSPSYIPPGFISSYSGDEASRLRPAIQISFIKDSIQGTFGGRLINILYRNALPDTTYHEMTNGKFKIKINHSSGGI